VVSNKQPVTVAPGCVFVRLDKLKATVNYLHLVVVGLVLGLPL
jgi:hypothetical protein